MCAFFSCINSFGTSKLCYMNDSCSKINIEPRERELVQFKIVKNCDIRRWYLGSLWHESNFESNINYFSAVFRRSRCTFKTYLVQLTLSLRWQIYNICLLLVYHQPDVSIGMLSCMRKAGMLLQKHPSLAEPWIPNRMMEHIASDFAIHPKRQLRPFLVHRVYESSIRRQKKPLTTLRNKRKIWQPTVEGLIERNCEKNRNHQCTYLILYRRLPE